MRALKSLFTKFNPFLPDKEGKVRIWDTVNKEHILKAEHAAMAGLIKDIDWTMDNQKLIVVGEGRER